MRLGLRCAVAVSSIVFTSHCVQAQNVSSTPLPVGSGPGQIGLVVAPNEECRGPATVTAASGGRLAILDRVNRKIVVIGSSAAEDVPLPIDLVEPADFLAVARGYVVAGALGDVVLVNDHGAVLARTTASHNPEFGAVRLVPLVSGALALEDIKGERTSIDLSRAQTGELVVPGLAAAAAYLRTNTSPNQVVLENNSVRGPLGSITVTSGIRIVSARVVWVNEGSGALIVAQEAHRLPEEAAFVRLVTFDDSGRPTSEAYLGPDVFACDTKRPFVRLTDGRVVSLAFRGRTLAVEAISFEPIGHAVPKTLGQRSDATLISQEEDDTLSALERLNGTSNVSAIALSPINRATILERARAPLEIKWHLAPANFSHAGVPSVCQPPENIWMRPPRLDAELGREVKAIPYRWGGYVSTLETFKTHLNDGRLAGDVCTCRNANCVYPEATGQDCSGFVSFAWNTGSYFTTGSLPSPNVSAPVLWDDLAPGDIVNRARSHVRLIESIAISPNGRVMTVIESAMRADCGGVCRRPYLESELQEQGYRPLRRLNLTE